MMLSLDMAKRMLNAGVKQAQGMGNPCSIAIVDENGWLVALHRMDGAVIPSVDIARDKAWTAAAFRLPSSAISKFGNLSMPGFGLNMQNWNDRLTPIPGGLPIEDGGDVIGAVGVCGDTPEQDVVICQAAIAALSAQA
jgi:uncharacterized protein GlcG (DUF336 family)